MGGDFLAQRLRQLGDVGPRQKRGRVEKRERAFLLREIGRSVISRLRNDAEPAVDQREAFRRAVARAAENQRIRQSRHAKPDAPLGDSFGALLGQRKARNVDHIVEQPHGHAHQPRQFLLVEMPVVSERRLTSFARLIEPNRHAP